MSLKKIKFLFIGLLIIFFSNITFANDSVKSIGKFKDWESFSLKENEQKVCFAQSIPILQSPKNSERTSRLFVTFRPGDKIKDEISVTAGYIFNNKNKVTAKSGKNIYRFSTVQENFAWFQENKTEKKFIKTLKKGSRLMVTGYNTQNSQTIDHYSLLGFTKAYNTAKKSCS
ncbi:MAG: hypothetical protein CMI76_01490 [Candidatus Pelagibacter sp.]|nr:hypothetical protein [Candidatus Pelagibacter sp.]